MAGWMSPELQGAIKEAKYMLKLERGWDGENGFPVYPYTFELATSTLSIIEGATAHRRMYIPEIRAVSDGSIDLSWIEGDLKALMNVKANGALSWYGEFKDYICKDQCHYEDFFEEERTGYKNPNFINFYRFVFLVTKVVE